MLKGSVLKAGNVRYLQAARIYLARIKQAKLKMRHQAHKDDSWDILNLLGHLNSEVIELNQAYFGKEMPFRLLDETADISNMCDILTMGILNEWRHERWDAKAK